MRNRMPRKVTPGGEVVITGAIVDRATIDRRISKLTTIFCAHGIVDPDWRFLYRIACLDHQASPVSIYQDVGSKKNGHLDTRGPVEDVEAALRLLRVALIRCEAAAQEESRDKINVSAHFLGGESSYRGFLETMHSHAIATLQMGLLLNGKSRPVNVRYYELISLVAVASDHCKSLEFSAFAKLVFDCDQAILAAGCTFDGLDHGAAPTLAEAKRRIKKFEELYGRNFSEGAEIHLSQPSPSAFRRNVSWD